MLMLSLLCVDTIIEGVLSQTNTIWNKQKSTLLTSLTQSKCSVKDAVVSRMMRVCLDSVRYFVSGE